MTWVSIDYCRIGSVTIVLRTQVRNTVTPARDRHLVATSSPRSPRPPAPLSGPSLSCDSLAPTPRPSGTRGPHAVVALIRTTLAPIRPNSDLDHRFLRSVAQSLSAPHSLSSRTSFISSCISLLSFSPVSPSGLTDTFYRRPRPPCMYALMYISKHGKSNASHRLQHQFLLVEYICLSYSLALLPLVVSTLDRTVLFVRRSLA
ncbi:hypothetical protein RHS04_06577 [Rhizoctonia solani]|uniref:Uncharacterized protein n=1 Tax=Rhizoctonia solani TaxID=456999 RepID=A0A8H7H5V3_9AGAM|nr:hypothetical protein RHS04_06577 [Rhizoctonia solani]